jgi:hypothetical protein
MENAPPHGRNIRAGVVELKLELSLCAEYQSPQAATGTHVQATQL